MALVDDYEVELVAPEPLQARGPAHRLHRPHRHHVGQDAVDAAARVLLRLLQPGLHARRLPYLVAGLLKQFAAVRENQNPFAAHHGPLGEGREKHRLSGARRQAGQRRTEAAPERGLHGVGRRPLHHDLGAPVVARHLQRPGPTELDRLGYRRAPLPIEDEHDRPVLLLDVERLVELAPGEPPCPTVEAPVPPQQRLGVREVLRPFASPLGEVGLLYFVIRQLHDTSALLPSSSILLAVSLAPHSGTREILTYTVLTA